MYNTKIDISRLKLKSNFFLKKLKTRNNIIFKSKNSESTNKKCRL